MWADDTQDYIAHVLPCIRRAKRAEALQQTITAGSLKTTATIQRPANDDTSNPRYRNSTVVKPTTDTKPEIVTLITEECLTSVATVSNPSSTSTYLRPAPLQEVPASTTMRPTTDTKREVPAIITPANSSHGMSVMKPMIGISPT